jgi:hypothetical protein
MHLAGRANEASTLTCPTNDPAPVGFGTHITYNGVVNGYDLNITSNPSIKVWVNKHLDSTIF